MRQIVYASLSSVPEGADLSGILQQSRHIAIDGITALLWSDGKSFLQAIEGPRVSIEACFERIKRDTRHYYLTALCDRHTTSHEFGSWNMVHRRANEEASLYDAQVRRLLHQASNDVRAHFTALIGSTTRRLLCRSKPHPSSLSPSRRRTCKSRLHRLCWVSRTRAVPPKSDRRRDQRRRGPSPRSCPNAGRQD
jgi:hypothetical protein